MPDRAVTHPAPPESRRQTPNSLCPVATCGLMSLMGSHGAVSGPEAERLHLLQEECAEVIQAVSKVLRHGWDQRHPSRPSLSNRQDLEAEVGHLRFALGLLEQNLDVNSTAVHQSATRKGSTIAPFLHFPQGDLTLVRV
jgi:NTP pyrophosphatase (non-canonical NTP hydrolase)